MAVIQGPGKWRNLGQNARLSAVDISEGVALARTGAIAAVFGLFGQDWDQTAVRRGAFKPTAFCPIPTSPASMAVKITPGYCLLNNGDNLTGGWLSLRLSAAHNVSIPAAHPTLTRYDILYLQTTFALVEPILTEFRDPVSLNIYEANLEKYALDAANFGVQQGVAGDPDPGVTCLDAYTLLPAGKIPIAIVQVAPAATNIPLANIKDVREIFEVKQVRDDYSDDPDVITQLGDIYPAMGIGKVAQVTSAAGRNNIPPLSVFYDQTDGKFKAKKPNGDVVDLSA